MVHLKVNMNDLELIIIPCEIFDVYPYYRLCQWTNIQLGDRNLTTGLERKDLVTI